jgi:hypothetical protein
VRRFALVLQTCTNLCQVCHSDSCSVSLFFLVVRILIRQSEFNEMPSFDTRYRGVLIERKGVVCMSD